MNTFENSQRLMTLQAITYTTTGVDISDSNSFTSPTQYDSFDNWLGEDFDYILDNILDSFFADIEADLLSVWSTNKSEQESAQASAMRSALASAQGITDDGVAADDGGSGFTGSMESDSEGVPSSDSSALSEASLDHDLSDHSGFKHKHEHPDESRYSGTQSENLGGDTQGSYSLASSDGDGVSVSTQSIQLQSYQEFYEDANNTGSYTINGLGNDTGDPTIEWIGDMDN